VTVAKSRPPKSVAVIGTGLIGTSIALALRSARGRTPTLRGWDTRKASRVAAAASRAFDAIARSMEEAVEDADIVIIAAPLDATIKLLPRVIATVKKGALVIDVTGVKAPVVAAAGKALRKRPDLGFVSGHPMAGREKAGAANADPALFAGRSFALCAPAHPRRAAALARAELLVRSLRAKPVRIPPEAHDRLVAATSALPQLCSLALALAVDAATAGKARSLAGPGYADATRLAASPYRIWRPVLKATRPAVVRALRHFERALRDLIAAARRADDRAMERLFLRAAASRRRVVAE
jgi:prephenate dehydrogenase